MALQLQIATEHISARIIGEAMALLHNSDWNISGIAYALGFEYSAYFTIFFKKQTGLTPVVARLAAVEARLPAVETRLAAVEARLPAV